MKVYIAGPITGIEDGNRPAFAKMAQRLTEAGHEPVNPWDVPLDHGERPCCPGEHEPDSGHTLTPMITRSATRMGGVSTVVMDVAGGQSDLLAL